MIYSTTYVHNKSIKMLRLHYDELIGKIEVKIYLIVDYYILDRVLDKIKKIIDIEKFDNTKILIDTDDKLPNYITFKNVKTLITCVIKDDGKLYPQIFSEKTLYVK